MDSPGLCLSWLSVSKESDFVGPPNPWFDYYNYVLPSPTISVENPNWGRELNLEDEEIEGLFNLQLDIQDFYIEVLFPSSNEESLDDDDLKSNITSGKNLICCSFFGHNMLRFRPQALVIATEGLL